MRMKMQSLFLFLMLSFCALFAAVAMAAPTEAEKQDGAIIEILNVINGNEIAASQEAVKRTDNASVKKLAETMISNHSQNLADSKKLAEKIHITPVISIKSNSLKNQGEKLLKSLQKTPSNEFDVKYVDAMVKGHEEALKGITDELLPKASNPDLKAFLQATSEVVSHHLEMAKAVQSKLFSPQ